MNPTPLLGLTTLLWISALSAQTVPTPDLIIERHIDARGGYERIKAIQTMIFSRGLYEESDYKGSGNAFMAFKRPYFKVVGNPEERSGFSEGYDGAAWEWFEEPGVVIRTVGPASGAARRGSIFEGPLVDYEAKGSRLKQHDDTNVDGRRVYHLTLTTLDGFERDYLIDAKTYLIIAERRSAPFHAFGDSVTSETRYQDYRPVAGVLFPHRYVETVIATGETLTQMQWRSIEANGDLPDSWFKPPQFERTPFQTFIEHLYFQRSDIDALMWSYAEYRRVNPGVDTGPAAEFVGYQMLKMGDIDAAITLLKANSEHYPGSATAAFGLGRAQQTGGDIDSARAELERALALDPDYERATRMLASLD